MVLERESWVYSLLNENAAFIIVPAADIDKTASCQVNVGSLDIAEFDSFVRFTQISETPVTADVFCAQHCYVWLQIFLLALFHCIKDRDTFHSL